jgi:hypothetical protein
MRRAILIAVCGLALAAPPSAAAAGGPAPVVFWQPVAAPGSPFQYLAGPRGTGTVIERVGRAGGAVEAVTRVPGAFGVPGAAYDGSTTGLSADGATLVLAGQSNPAGPTRLLVVSTPALHVRARITLRGFFTVDAISPTGRWLYLIHYRSAANPFDYEVRAYDLVRRRMLPRPVVDPREPREKMQGVPLVRAMGPGERWAYTLYLERNGHAFIHALDTAGLSARCVDLPVVPGVDYSSPGLVLSGGGLLVENDGQAFAVMNTRRFAVRVVRPAATPAASPPAHRSVAVRHGRAGLAWPVVVGPFALLLALALARRPLLTRLRVKASPDTLGPHTIHWPPGP